jgi:protein N-terminal amidase
MRLACLQFAPQVGDIDNNLSRADAVLRKAADELGRLDLLVLPELALTGTSHFQTLVRKLTPTLQGTTLGLCSTFTPP